MPRRPDSRRWLKMGIELEGSWEEPHHTVAAKVSGAQAKGDGSIVGLPGHMGEIITRPHAILDSLCEDTAALYPNHVNQSCGFHIHASFNEMDYSALMDTAFWDYYRKRWSVWGEEMEADFTRNDATRFWSRYKGTSEGARSYCKAEFWPAEQMARKKERYYQLNFSAWAKYKTLESRMLPMFEDKALAVKAIREMSDIYDRYLNEYDFPKIKEEKVILTAGEEVVETVRLVLPDGSPWEEQVKEKPLAPLLRGDDVHYDIPGARELMFPWNTRISDSESEP